MERCKMANLNSPVVSWYNVDTVNPANSNTVQIAQPYDFGVVDAGYTPTPDDYYSFLIWNNRDERNSNAPQMEEVTIGIKDMSGGNGNTVGSEVWAINGTTKWFWAKVDSLRETDADFAEIGADLTKPIGAGTSNSTTHPDVAKSVDWVASTTYSIGDVVNPSSDNGYVYRAVTGGQTGTVEPTWSTVEGEKKLDGTVEWITVKKIKTPSANNIILGGVNDGSLANAKGNYTQVTLKIEVPLSATSGRQSFKLRTSYRYI